VADKYETTMSGSPDEENSRSFARRKWSSYRTAPTHRARAIRKAAQQQADAQKKAVLRQHLTDEARKRLNTVKMSKPQFGEQVERQVVSLARSGRIQARLTTTR